MGREHFIPCCTILGGNYVITNVIVGHDAMCSNEISLGKTGYESDITDSHATSFNHAENQHITFLLCLFAGFTAVP